MSDFFYIAEFGSLYSALKFTEQKSNVKSSNWGTYFARYSFHNKSVLKFSGQSAGIVSSTWTYTAIPGKFGFGGTSLVNTAYSYYSYEPTGGEQGVNSHPGIILKGFAPRRSSNWNYISNFGFAGESRLLFHNVPAIVQAFHIPYVASGNIKIGSGSSGFFVYNASGRISTGSSSSIVLTYSSIPIGNIRASGTAGIVVFLNAYIPIGNICVVGGSNSPSYYRPQYTAGGLIFTGGNSNEGMDRWSFVASGGIVFYTPSYFEIINRQNPLGFWIKNETTGPLTNSGTLASLADASVFGTPFFDRFNWIPTQPDAKSVNFDSLFTYALVPSCVEINDNLLKRRTISFVIHMYDVLRRSCIYDESSTVNGLNVYVFNGYLYFHVFSFQGLGFISYSIQIPILADRTYHALFTFDADNPVDTIVGYLNGNKSASSDIVWLAASELPPRNPVGFGAKINGTRYNDDHSVNGEPSRGRGHYLKGDLQALSVWNDVLSPEAISLQANAISSNYSFAPLFIGVGGVCTDGICETAFSDYNYTSASNKIVTTNSADNKIIFIYEASGGNATVGPGFTYLTVFAAGNSVFKGSAGILSSNWLTSSTGGLQLGGLSNCKITFNYQANGTIAINSLTTVASSSNLSVSFGNAVFSGSVISGFFVDLNHVANGKAVLSNATAASYSMVYSASGGMKYINSTASALYSMDVEKDFTWDISKGILKYWRVEGRPKPFSCPPIGGSASTYKSDSYISYVTNVMAYSVSEVCEKLKEKSFYGPIKRIQVFSHPALVEDRDETFDPTCNTLTDVNPNTAACLEFLVDANILINIGVSTFVVSNFIYVASGGVSGSIKTSGITEAQSSTWVYVSSGGIVAGNESVNSSPGNPFVKAFGGSVFGGNASYYSSYGGEFYVSAGAFVTTVSEGIKYGFEVSSQLIAIDNAISTLCCGNLPATLFLNHEFNRFNRLSSFMHINGFSFERNLHMVYSKKKGLWANNLHYKGIGTTNDLETWDIISEFGCMDNLGGLKVSGSLLGLSFIVKNRNLRTLNDSYTRIVIGFNPEDVCSLDGSLDYAITLNTKNKVTEATMDTTIIIHDGIGLFQNRSFVINPNIDFRVTTFSALSPVPNLNLSRPLQELLV
jgi:hypothetical protein